MDVVHDNFAGMVRTPVLHTRNARKLTLVSTVGLVVIAAAVAGVVRGISALPADEPFGKLPWLSEGEAQAEDPIVAERGLAQVEPPDPALQFPNALRDLPASPYDLAVDESGTLWFALFDASVDTNTLYRYDPASSGLMRFAIPESDGSAMVSEIEVDERGHVIWAEGHVVLDFDPATDSYKEIRLAPPSSPVSYIPPAGTYITAMGLDGNGHAYVSRMNVAALTEIDLRSRTVREIPYPAGFGPVHDLAVAEGAVWITNPFDMENGPRAQAGRIDVQTGGYADIEGAPAVFAKGPGGSLYGTTFEKGGLASITGSTLSAAAPVDSAFASLGVPDGDVVAVDGQSGVVWASNAVVRGLLRFDPTSSSVRSYPSGTYLTAPVSCPLPPVVQTVACDETVRVSPVISGLAVDPNGNLYFSDAAFNRIGVIRAGR